MTNGLYFVYIFALEGSSNLNQVTILVYDKSKPKVEYAISNMSLVLELTFLHLM